ncbi:MAG: EamA family transporter [Nanoarchaeota archaeon]
MEWYTLVLISALLAALISIIRKKVLLKEHASEFITTAHLFMAFLLLPVLSKIDINIDLITFLLILIKGIIAAISGIMLARAARHLEISTVEPLRNLTVVFVLLLSFIFLGESVGIQHGIGLVLTIAGSYFLDVKKDSIKYSKPHRKYIMYMIIQVFLVAILVLMDRIILQRTTVYTLLILPVYITTIILLIYQSLKYKGLEDVWHSVRTGGVWIVFAVIFAIASDLTYLMAVSIPTAMIALIMALRRTSTLISTIVGGEIFHDHNLIQKIAASVVILAGVYLIIL